MIIYYYGIHSFMPGRIRKFFSAAISELGLRRGYMTREQAFQVAKNSLATRQIGEVTYKIKDQAGNIHKVIFRKRPDASVEEVSE